MHHVRYLDLLFPYFQYGYLSTGKKLPKRKFHHFSRYRPFIREEEKQKEEEEQGKKEEEDKLRLS